MASLAVVPQGAARQQASTLIVLALIASKLLDLSSQKQLLIGFKGLLGCHWPPWKQRTTSLAMTLHRGCGKH